MTAPVLVFSRPGSAADRARQLYAFRDDVETTTDLRQALAEVSRRRRRVLVVIDVNEPTTIAAVVARARRLRVLVDTGDLVYELERSRGTRSRPGLGLVWLGERAALAAASHVVVRGTEHADLLPGTKPATFAPDVAPDEARPEPTAGIRIRERLGLTGFVVGLVGSLNTAPKLGIVYGWDVVDALAQTSADTQALIVGDGPGLAELRERASRRGVLDRCRFPGRVAPEDVSEWIAAMDVAVSTQTNDRVGRVRTAGKLPLYLASGCPVLASDVGEARRLLGPLGWTLRYDGVVDNAYPTRLAAAVDTLAGDPAELERRRTQALTLSREEFDLDMVRGRVGVALDQLLERRR